MSRKLPYKTNDQKMRMLAKNLGDIELVIVLSKLEDIALAARDMPIEELKASMDKNGTSMFMSATLVKDTWAKVLGMLSHGEEK